MRVLARRPAPRSARASRAQLRRRSFASAARTSAFAIDVEGCIFRGGRALPGAIETLAVLQEQQVPFILLSNGSGTTEESKAAHYSEVLGLPIREDQIQDANTPMRALAEKHRDDLVVIVGKRGAADLAESYGFNNAVTAEEYHHEFPDIYPDVQPPYTYPMQLSGREMDSMVDLWYNSGEAPEPREALRQKVKAILIVADPVPWGRDLQICMDLLRSDGHPDVRIDSQEVACYVSCCDFEYSSTWPVPRLGNGAFTIALDAIYEKAFGEPLQKVLFGKPHKVTFDYAQATLFAAAEENGQTIDTIYKHSSERV